MSNDYIEIRKSGISGNGVFAKKLIKKGEMIWILDGEVCNIDEMIRRVDEDLDDENGSGRILRYYTRHNDRKSIATSTPMPITHRSFVSFIQH